MSVTFPVMADGFAGTDVSVSGPAASASTPVPLLCTVSPPAMSTCAPLRRFIPTVLFSRRNFVSPKGATTLPSLRSSPNVLFEALIWAGTYDVKLASAMMRPAKPLLSAVSVLPCDACHPKNGHTTAARGDQSIASVLVQLDL